MMDFYTVLDQVVNLLRSRGRVSYRALQRQFGLDGDYIADLKVELIEVQQLAVDQDGKMLVWIGKVVSPPTEPQTPEAERRQLTVMFCDLVDSTALAARLGPEDYREVVRAYQQTCAAVIQRFDGSIAQYLGDGLLVYFGYPQAHEDDVQRAVRAGLGIVYAMGQLQARLERGTGIRLAVRIGIHTGLVVVGEIGAGVRQERLALGDTPNIAARLQGLAAPDTVAISAATHGLVQGFFTCQMLGVQTLKGVPQPMPVYRVLQESGAQSRLEVAAMRGPTPLVGRGQEVGLLLERWAQAKDGMGQVVLLGGEAGIGKSRLAQVLKEQVGSEGYTRIEFRCSPYYTNSALYPVIEHVERLLQFRRDNAPETKLDKLERVLRAYCLPLTEVMPPLAAFLSLLHPHGYAPLNLSPQRQRQKTQEALVAWLLAEAERQPLLVVWEDLHWADPSSLEFLGLLIDQAPTACLLTLLTYRLEFRPPWAPRSHVTQLTLTRFTRPQVEAMVECLTSRKALPPEEGLSALAEALVAVDRTGERFYEAELHRLQGELLLRHDVPAEQQAEACFRQALDVARRQQAKSLELRAAMSLSRLWQLQGKRDAARQLLAGIYGWFTEGFDTADLQEARALLAALL